MKGLRTTKPYRWHKRAWKPNKKNPRVTSVLTRNHVPEFTPQDLSQETEDVGEMWEMVSELPQGSVVSLSEIAESERESDVVSILSLTGTTGMNQSNRGGLHAAQEIVRLREIPTHQLMVEVVRRLLELLVRVVQGFLWIANLVFGVIIHLREVRNEERPPRNLRDRREE